MKEIKPISRKEGSLQNGPVDDLEFPSVCQSILSFMSYKSWDLQQVSDAIGDSPERLERVIQGDEPLGKTAQLALLANYYGLAPISRED